MLRTCVSVHKAIHACWKRPLVPPKNPRGKKKKKKKLVQGQHPPKQHEAGTCGSQDVEMKAEPALKVYPPEPGAHWYLGQQKEPMFQRSCVEDMVTVMMRYAPWGDLKARAPMCFVVTGASGIGKSWSLNLLAQLLLDRGVSILVHVAQEATAVLHTRERPITYWKGTSVRPDVSVFLQTHPDVWYLYDSPGSKEKCDSAYARKNGFSIIFSSPKESNYGVAIKEPHRFFHLPPWTKEELAGAAEVLKIESRLVNACYAAWGGNIRALVNFQTDGKYQAALESTVVSLSAEIFRNIRRMNKAQAEHAQKHADLGRVLIPVPVNVDITDEDAFRAFRWEFCSVAAEVAFLNRLKNEDEDAVRAFCKESFTTPGTQGILFEKFAHFLLTNSKIRRFACKAYKESKRDDLHDVEFPRLETKQFDSLVELEVLIKDALKQKAPTAFEPKSPSFDAVDMFALFQWTKGGWHFMMIQDTIGRKHSFHPVKLLEYRLLWEGASQGHVQTCDWSYAIVTPRSEPDKFTLEKETCSRKTTDVSKVAKLLKVARGRKKEATWMESVLRQAANVCKEKTIIIYDVVAKA